MKQKPTRSFVTYVTYPIQCINTHQFVFMVIRNCLMTTINVTFKKTFLCLEGYTYESTTGKAEHGRDFV
jgi:hypothetical protein